jgi:NAD dependent epimerase/dehydratase family enzyme
MNPLAVVTGGTKGIGRALIERFMSGGFDIITCARNPNDLEDLEKEMKGRFAGSALYYLPADLSLRTDVDAFLTLSNQKTGLQRYWSTIPAYLSPGRCIMRRKAHWKKQWRPMFTAPITSQEASSEI